MSTLATITVDVAAAIPPGHAVVVGPPFRLPPAAPCVVVELPRVREVLGVGDGCRVTAATIDVVIVPPTATDADALLATADELIGVFGGQVTAGQVEPSPYTTADDAHVFRLTLEV